MTQADCCIEQLEECLAYCEVKGIYPIFIIPALSDIMVRVARTEEAGPVVALQSAISRVEGERRSHPDRPGREHRASEEALQPSTALLTF